MIASFDPILKYFTAYYYFRDEDVLREAHFEDEESAKKFVIKAFFDSEIYLVEVNERYIYGSTRFKISHPMPMFSKIEKEEITK